MKFLSLLIVSIGTMCLVSCEYCIECSLEDNGSVVDTRESCAEDQETSDQTQAELEAAGYTCINS